MNRRRFLAITAAAIVAPRAVPAAVWQGNGFGAALSLRLENADPARARRVFRRVEAEIRVIEETASLFRDSSLTRLNRDGRLHHPPAPLVALLALAGEVHRATGGLFDPTVQPLWQAIATAGDTRAAAATIGFDRITVDEDEIRLARGQALTLNGIAQGWAADRIAAILRTAGFGQALVDMGEIVALGRRADGRDWQAAIAGPAGDRLAQVGLRDRALATSSPRGTVIGAGNPHILGPRGEVALWQTVSVTAPSAAVADALSTAFCLMPESAIRAALRAFPGADVAHLV